MICQAFTEDDVPDKLKKLLYFEADISLSVMAANTTGHQQTVHLRTIGLVVIVYAFAQ